MGEGSGYVVTDKFGNPEGFASNPSDPPDCPSCADLRARLERAERAISGACAVLEEHYRDYPAGWLAEPIPEYTSYPLRLHRQIYQRLKEAQNG